MDYTCIIHPEDRSMSIDIDSLAIKAHTLSKLAKEALETHEEICAERYEGIHRTLDQLHTQVTTHHSKEAREWERLYARVWSATVLITCLLLGGFGTMAWYVLTEVSVPQTTYVPPPQYDNYNRNTTTRLDTN